ncbi:CCA tRNA nucleotidyltransferase [Alkalihalobacterium elongatum]|uniref:CCA tRNA nucleotidyltransferase n=1 Tax=Alkalihalobacterium elongatum TaxID=2675466 RepID=UPI001C1F5638|nr:CCA tRNA nucleotidyltransferase [Alkalihalobacterium elongatum]
MEPLFYVGSKVIQTIEQKGYEAYFVGGAVRDFLLQRTINDIDIATSAPVELVEQFFDVTVPVGKEHGTIIVLFEDHSFEVTTFRTSSSNYPSLEEDLLKRDFTINAMAMNGKMELIDPFSFRKDLENKRIRAVANGMERFIEDPLRILRACRFSSQLNFMIEAETIEAMKSCRSLIEGVAIERTVVEFEKLIRASSFSRGVEYLLSTGLLPHISFLENKEEALNTLATLNLDALISLEEVWAAFLYVDNSERDYLSFLKELKKSKQFVHQVVRLLEALKRIEIYGWSKLLLYSYGLESSLKLGRILSVLNPRDLHLLTEQKIYSMYNHLPIKSRRDLNVNGKILVRLFQKIQGPWIEKLLIEVEEAVLEQKIQNDQNEILAWLMKERDF